MKRWEDHFYLDNTNNHRDFLDVGFSEEILFEAQTLSFSQ